MGPGQQANPSTGDQALGKLSEIAHQQALIMAVLLTRKLPEGLKAGEAQ